MGIHRHKTSTDFICDICGHAHVERHGPSFDEGRAATSLMRQDGWHFTKSHGEAWEATCSSCNIDATESLDDVLR